MERDYNEIDSQYVAAQLPVEGASTEPEANGVVGARDSASESKDAALARFEPSPLIEPYTAAAPFWHMPLEPGVFYDTPLLLHSQLADAERTTMQMESYLCRAGHVVKAIELRMHYTRLVKVPATQYEQLRHELEPQRAEHLQALKETQAELERAQTEFIQAMAAAKIPLPVPPEPRKRAKTPPVPEPISPQLVEKALNADFASGDAVCGEQGVAPVSSKGNVFTTVGQWLFEFFAPLAAGLLLGVNLGVITGLLSLEVLQRGEALWLVALAAVIGLFVEKLVGNTAYSLAASAAQASEQRDGMEGSSAFPTMRSTLRVALFTGTVAVLVIAIALVDALGLHMLYQERQAEAQLTGGDIGEAVPFWVFLIAGLIISAPYIVYKSVKGWREPEIRQREARVAYLHWKHVERRREEPSVQQAYLKAQTVQNLHQRRDWLQAELQRIEARLDSARTECIGATQKFCEHWNALVAWLGEERAPHTSTARRRAANQTLLQKLLGAFRR
ncbi:MAG: hypothetical protein KatS3mg020_0874 [Fimbriimonadales bacterium]|nr:MAG: hypothetical protein KatS3mg020_0874 [Fimbriimonadales bacterium]